MHVSLSFRKTPHIRMSGHVIWFLLVFNFSSFNKMCFTCILQRTFVEHATFFSLERHITLVCMILVVT